MMKNEGRGQVMAARHSIPERCNRPAWRSYPNGYRVCWDHARVNDPDETLHENSIGPCDYPRDARYEPGEEVTEGQTMSQHTPGPMARVMDRDTAEHFYAWLARTVPDDEQHTVEQQIHRLLREHPDLIDKGRSWPEMRTLAERNYT